MIVSAGFQRVVGVALSLSTVFVIGSACLVRADSLSSTTLLKTDESGLGLELVRGRSYTRFVISTGANSPVYKLQRLTDPDRLVVDLTQLEGRLNRSIDIPDSVFVDKVRLAAHEEKERLVLDLGANVEHDVDVIDGKIILTLSEPIAPLAAAPPIMAAPEPENVTAGTEVSTDQVGADQVGIGQEGQTEDLRPKLTKLEISEVDSGTNQVVATVTSAGTFNIKRTAPSEYVLTLSEATLGADAMNTVVAAPQSGAIRSVRAVQEGSDVLLRIFSQPGAVLNAKARSGKIVVSASLGQNDGGPLAQLAEEKPPVVAALPNEDDIASLLEGEQKYTGRLISLDLQDTDIDNALRIIAEVSNLNIIASDDVTGKVTLRLIDVPWDQALDVILKTNGLDKVQELNVIRVAPVEKLRSEREALKEAEQAKELLEPLLVRYIRISYARSSEIKPLVEAVLTERGSVAVDERTNQVIIKDIQKGITHVAELVKKLDLRTPQVLLETQIVEAQRTFLRDLGSELGFSYVASPATGNATGHNFPNSINVSGAVSPGQISGSSFPAGITSSAGSAVSALFGSADGTKTLAARITALESEGRIRIVSRPSVATINNKPATIKSVEKIRVKLPSSGLSVATGQGASASGGGNAATESFEVGITLDVVPQASPDYFVLLDITAKSSTLGATVVDGIPSEVERSATSSVLVSSGQTFALGGIYKITDSDTIDGVPFFKDIPVFGHLFRRGLVDNGDEELIFFITPRIVEGSFDDAAMRSSNG